MAITERPDVILLDINLGEVRDDGIGVCRKLKGMAHTASTPIVMVSATEANMKKAFDAGADDYLVKPVTASTIRSKVDQFIGGRRA
jgi:DNA-binding response OmpR family regulator